MESNTNKIKQFWNKKAKIHGTNQSATLGEIAVRHLEINEISKHIKDGYKVLDVGCGNGYTTMILANKYNISILGIDYAERMIEQAKIKTEPENLSSQINFDVQDCTQLQLEENTFDLVYTERCIQNLPNVKLQEKAILECIRVLKPGGRLLLIECSKEGLKNLNKIRKLIGRKEIIDAEPWHNNFLYDELIIDFVKKNHQLNGIKINHFSSTYTIFTRILPFWRLFYYSKWFFRIPNLGSLGYFKAYIIDKNSA